MRRGDTVDGYEVLFANSNHFNEEVALVRMNDPERCGRESYEAWLFLAGEKTIEAKGFGIDYDWVKKQFATLCIQYEIVNPFHS